MARYWIKIEESVEGPYESQLLKFVQGFGKETFVCQEESQTEEFWQRAEEVTELRKILALPELPAAAKNSLSAPESRTQEQDKIEVAPPAKEEIAEPPITPEETHLNLVAPPEQKEEIHSASLADEKQMEQDTETDILEVMEKLSEEMKKQKQAKEEPMLSSSEVAKPVPQEMVVSEPKTSIFRNIKFKIVITGIALLSLGIATLFLKGGSLWKPDFFLTIKKKFVSGKESTQPEPVQKKLIPEKPVEIKPIRENPDLNRDEVPKARAFSNKIKIEKPKPKARNKIAKSTATASSEEELKDQKYLLPGVPSPQVTQEKQKPPTIEKEEKKKAREKQFKEVEWMTRSGW